MSNSTLSVSRATFLVTLSTTIVASLLSLFLVIRLKFAGIPERYNDAINLSGHSDGNGVTISKCKACQELTAIYRRAGNDFANGGLDTATIVAIQPWFHGTTDSGRLWPKRYEDFPEPLPKGAVRLMVIPMNEDPSFVQAAAAITRDVLAVLPRQAKVFCNHESHYHCTVFHTSHPTDVRPDPFLASGGLASDGARSTTTGPTHAVLVAEAEAAAQVIKSSSAPTLVLDSILMTNSGTLLVGWVDPSGQLADLRAKLRATFPGACKKQASLIHTSLLRLLSEQQLEHETIAAVVEVCARWTQRLKGMVWVPPAAVWIQEFEFGTIVGDKFRTEFESPLAVVPAASAASLSGVS